MDRINSTGTILNAAGHRIRVARNTATGVPGTVIDATYDNNLQEEMMAIITLFGEAPSAASTTQILTVLQMLPRAPNFLNVVLGSGVGSSTFPENCTRIMGFLTAASGGSSGATSTGGSTFGPPGLAGGGAGAGMTAFFAGPITPGDGFSWTIGAGGAAGGSGNPGGQGGNSLIEIDGNILSVSGGGGAGTPSNTTGGFGGTTSTGAMPAAFFSLLIPGGDGGDGSYDSNISGGCGGASFWGGGGRAGTTGGMPGRGWGSGPGGGYTANGPNGMAGTNGILVIMG